MAKKTGVGIMMLCLGILTLSILVFSGCNTAKGIGEDVGEVGDAIERGSGQ